METNIVVSPCAHPREELPPLLAGYSRLGFRKFEVFSGWARSAIPADNQADAWREQAKAAGIAFSSYHLPPISPKDFDASLELAVKSAFFARKLGAKVVIFKAVDRPTYIRAAAPFLVAIQGLDVVPVLQNHNGTAITTVDDYREVIEGIADSRMKTLLEVGHFHAAGVHWEEGYALLRGSIALVHLKDLRDGKSLAFGEGEIDLREIFHRLHTDGYRGDYVVEVESGEEQDNFELLARTRQFLTTVPEARL